MHETETQSVNFFACCYVVTNRGIDTARKSIAHLDAAIWCSSKNDTFYKMFTKDGGTIASFAQILIFEKPKLAHEYTTFLMFLL
jgi:hypothetical protein